MPTEDLYEKYLQAYNEKYGKQAAKETKTSTQQQNISVKNTDTAGVNIKGSELQDGVLHGDMQGLWNETANEGRNTGYQAGLNKNTQAYSQTTKKTKATAKTAVSKIDAADYIINPEKYHVEEQKDAFGFPVSSVNQMPNILTQKPQTLQAPVKKEMYTPKNTKAVVSYQDSETGNKGLKVGNIANTNNLTDKDLESIANSMSAQTFSKDGVGIWFTKEDVRGIIDSGDYEIYNIKGESFLRPTNKHSEELVKDAEQRKKESFEELKTNYDTYYKDLDDFQNEVSNNSELSGMDKAFIRSFIKKGKDNLNAAVKESGWFRGFMNSGLSWNTLTAGFKDAGAMIEVAQAADAFRTNFTYNLGRNTDPNKTRDEIVEQTLQGMSVKDRLLIEAFQKMLGTTTMVEDFIRNTYKSGNSAGESVAFMLDMMIGRGVATAIRKGVVKGATKMGIKAATKTAEELAETTIKNGFKAYLKTGSRELLKTATTPTALVTTAISPQTYEIIAENKAISYLNNREYTTKDLWHDITDAYIENWTETLGGGLIEKAFGLAVFPLKSWIGSLPLFKNMKPSTWYSLVKNGTMFNGIFGEFGEEYLGSLTRTGLGQAFNDTKWKEDWENFISADSQDVLFWSLLPTTGAMSLFGVGANIHAGHQYRNAKSHLLSTAERMGIKDEMEQAVTVMEMQIGQGTLVLGKDRKGELVFTPENARFLGSLKKMAANGEDLHQIGIALDAYINKALNIAEYFEDFRREYNTWTPERQQEYKKKVADSIAREAVNTEIYRTVRDARLYTLQGKDGQFNTYVLLVGGENGNGVVVGEETSNTGETKYKVKDQATGDVFSATYGELQERYQPKEGDDVIRFHKSGDMLRYLSTQVDMNTTLGREIHTRQLLNDVIKTGEDGEQFVEEAKLMPKDGEEEGESIYIKDINNETGTATIVREDGSVDQVSVDNIEKDSLVQNPLHIYIKNSQDVFNAVDMMGEQMSMDPEDVDIDQVLARSLDGKVRDEVEDIKEDQAKGVKIEEKEKVEEKQKPKKFTEKADIKVGDVLNLEDENGNWTEAEVVKFGGGQITFAIGRGEESYPISMAKDKYRYTFKEKVKREEEKKEEKKETPAPKTESKAEEKKKSFDEKVKSAEIYDDAPEQTWDNLMEELDDDEGEAQNYVQNRIKTIKGQRTKKQNSNPSTIEGIKKKKEDINLLTSQIDYWEKVAQISSTRKAEQETKERLEQKQTQKAEQTQKAAQRQEQIRENADLGTLQARFSSAEQKKGHKGSKTLPNGEKIRGQYVLVESDTLSPSHNVNSNFAQTDGFPRREDGTTLNDRDYQNDKAAQDQVRQRSQAYDDRAVGDMPIVDENGVVLSGNDRTMSGQLAAQQGTDTEYIDSLKENAQMYGFSMEDVEGMEHPRIVFVLDEPMDYTTENFAKFNANEKKAQNNTEKAVKVGKTMDSKTLQTIADTISGYDSIADCLSSEQGAKDIIDILVGKGIIQRNDVANYMNGNSMNESGKELIETIIIGATLNENSVRMVNEMPFLRKSILTALNEVLQNKALKNDYSLYDEINKAVEIVYKAHKMGIKQGESLEAYYNQRDLFTGKSNIENITIQAIADKMNSTKVMELKKILSLYNQNAMESANGQMDIFSNEVLTKEDIIVNILKQQGYVTSTESSIVSTGRNDNEDNGGTSRNEPGRSEKGSQTKAGRNGKTTSQQTGLVDNQFANQLSKDRKDLLDQIARKLGMPIEIKKLSVAENGYYDPNTNTLVINSKLLEKGNDRFLSFILGHELTHKIKDASEKDSKLWDAYVQTVKVAMGQKAYKRVFDSTYNTYYKFFTEEKEYTPEQAKALLTKEYIDEEVAADFAGENIFNEEFAKQVADGLYQVDKAKIQEIIDMIKKMFNDLISYVKATDKDMAKNLENARDMWVAMFQESAVEEDKRLHEEATAGKEEGTGAGESDENIKLSVVIKPDDKREVAIVKAEKEHGFKNFKEAKQWAKENIVGEYENSEIGIVNISNKSIDKYLSGKAVEKSLNVDVHLSTLKVVPSIIENSVVGEIHEDNKGDVNIRDIVRLYGCVDIDGTLYRVKSTVKRYVNDNEKTKAYSYEVTEIELLEGETNDAQRPHPNSTSNSIPVANLVNNSQTDKGNEKKFSVSAPVEKKGNLVAIHNLNADKLNKSLDLGGMPMPSIAITKVDMEHKNFGDISLVFDKETINPSDKRNVVWSGDAWTPMIPEIEKKLSAEVVNRLYDKINNLVPKDKRIDDLYFEDVNISDKLRSWDWDVIKAYADNGVMKQAYLAEQGKSFKVPMKEKRYGYNNELLRKIVDVSREAEKEGIDIGESVVFFNDDNNPKYKESVDKIQELKLQDCIEKALSKMSDLSEEDKKQFEEDARKYHKPLDFQNYARLVDTAERMNRDLRGNNDKIPQVPDMQVAKETIDKKVPSDNKKYNEWLRTQFEGIVEKEGIRNDKDLYTPSGNRRSFEQLHDDVNIGNILAYMLKQNERGGKGFFGSDIFGASSKKYQSMSEIRADADRLKNVDKDEYVKMKGDITNKLGKIVEESVGNESFGAMLDMRQDIVEALSQTHDVNGLYNKLHRLYSKFTKDHAKRLVDIVKEIQQLPEEYFEAKPRRVVSFNEVKVAVVPKGTKKELKDKMKAAGIKNIKTYDPAIEGNRAEVLNKATEKEDIRFSINVEETNRKFNEDLQKQIDGTLSKGYIYQIGNPSAILRSAGIPDLPIELASNRLSDKSLQENHPFDLEEVKDLPKAIHNPLAVFRSATHLNSNVILTELKHKGKNFVVALRTNIQRGKIEIREINDIRSIHYKDSNRSILNWIVNDLADYIAPNFYEDWFVPAKNKLLSKQQSNSAEVRRELDLTAKIIQNFENPSINEEKFSLAEEEKNIRFSINSDPEYVEAERLEKESVEEYKRTASVVVDNMLHNSGIEPQVMDSNDMYEMMLEKSPEQALKTKDGEIYGCVIDGKMYLTDDIATADTKVHEYTHMWDISCQKNNPELWQRGVELIKQTQLWQAIQESGLYSHLSENDLISEVHAQLTGKEGEKMLEEMVKDARINGSSRDIVKRISILNDLKNWLKKFWMWVKDTQVNWSKEDAKKVSLEDFVNMPMMDLAKGTKLKDTESAVLQAKMEVNEEFSQAAQAELRGEEYNKPIVPSDKPGVAEDGSVRTNDWWRGRLLYASSGWRWDKKEKKYVQSKLGKFMDRYLTGAFDSYATIRRLESMTKLKGIKLTNSVYADLVGVNDRIDGIRQVRVRERAIRHHILINDIIKNSDLSEKEIRELIAIRSMAGRTTDQIRKEWKRIDEKIKGLDTELFEAVEKGNIHEDAMVANLLKRGKVEEWEAEFWYGMNEIINNDISEEEITRKAEEIASKMPTRRFEDYEQKIDRLKTRAWETLAAEKYRDKYSYNKNTYDRSSGLYDAEEEGNGQVQGFNGEHDLKNAKIYKKIFGEEEYTQHTPIELVQAVEERLQGKAKEAYDKLTKDYAQMIQELNKYALDNNLIAIWQYEDYQWSDDTWVPLRGWDEQYRIYGEDSAKQKISEHKKGRMSLADDPLKYIYAEYETTIQMAVVNQAKRNLMNFLESVQGILVGNKMTANKAMYKWIPANPRAWARQIKDSKALLPESERNSNYVISTYAPKEEWISRDSKLSTIEQGILMDNNVFENDIQIFGEDYKYSHTKRGSDKNLMDYTFSFFDGNKVRRIVLNDKKLVKLLNTPTLQPKYTQSTAWKLMSGFTRFLSMYMTSRNPLFTLRNLERDWQEAMLVEVPGMEHYRANYNKSIGRNKAVVWAIATKPKDAVEKFDRISAAMRKGTATESEKKWYEVYKEYQEWLELGGSTGVVHHYKNIGDLMKTYKVKDTNTFTAIGKVISGEYFADAAEATENLIRFSTYCAFKKEGLNKHEAAYQSRESTVNFSRKGWLSRAVGGAFPFFGATVNSLYREARLLANNPKGFAAKYSLYLTIGFLLQVVHSMIGGDDDDYKYKWVGDYNKDRGMYIPFVGNAYIAVPQSAYLPHTIGRVIAQMFLGEKTELQGLAEVGNVMLNMAPDNVGSSFGELLKYNKVNDSIEPTGMTGLWAGIASGLTGGSLSMITDLIKNENFMGSKIVKEKNPYTNQTRAAREKTDKTYQMYSAMAEGWNRMFGTPGFMDFSLLMLNSEEYQNAIESKNGLYVDKDGKMHKMKTITGNDVQHVLESLNPFLTQTTGKTIDFFSGKKEQIPSNFPGTNIILSHLNKDQYFWEAYGVGSDLTDKYADYEKTKKGRDSESRERLESTSEYKMFKDFQRKKDEIFDKRTKLMGDIEKINNSDMIPYSKKREMTYKKYLEINHLWDDYIDKWHIKSLEHIKENK